MMTNWFLWSPQNHHVGLLEQQQPFTDHLLCARPRTSPPPPQHTDTCALFHFNLDSPTGIFVTLSWLCRWRNLGSEKLKNPLKAEQGPEFRMFYIPNPVSFYCTMMLWKESRVARNAKSKGLNVQIEFLNCKPWAIAAKYNCQIYNP